jgi:hypothetical protein
MILKKVSNLKILSGADMEKNKFKLSAVLLVMAYLIIFTTEISEYLSTYTDYAEIILVGIQVGTSFFFAYSTGGLIASFWFRLETKLVGKSDHLNVVVLDDYRSNVSKPVADEKSIFLTAVKKHLNFPKKLFGFKLIIAFTLLISVILGVIFVGYLKNKMDHSEFVLFSFVGGILLLLGGMVGLNIAKVFSVYIPRNIEYLGYGGVNEINPFFAANDDALSKSKKKMTITDYIKDKLWGIQLTCRVSLKKVLRVGSKNN